MNKLLRAMFAAAANMAGAAPVEASGTTWGDKSPLVTLSNGNLTATYGVEAGNGFIAAISSATKTTGKKWVEIRPNDAVAVMDNFLAGMVPSTYNPATDGDPTEVVGGAYHSPAAATNNTWIAFALDLTAGKGWFVNTNGTVPGGGDPVAGTSPDLTWTGGAEMNFFAAFWKNDEDTDAGSTCIVNFGATAYQLTPKTGYGAWD